MLCVDSCYLCKIRLIVSHLSNESGERLPVDLHAESRRIWQEPFSALESDAGAHYLGPKRIFRLIAFDHLVFGRQAARIPGPRRTEVQGRRLAYSGTPGVRRHMHVVSGRERRNLEPFADSTAGAQIGLCVIDGAAAEPRLKAEPGVFA